MDTLPITSEARHGQSVVETPVVRVNGTSVRSEADRLAVEEPLEIRLDHVDTAGERTRTNVAVTMRTPGHDVELALGFLFAESILSGYGDVDAVRHSGPGGGRLDSRNVVTVRLRRDVTFDAARLDRHFYTTSSCGVCGKTSLEALDVTGCAPLPPGPVLDAVRIHRLPDALRAAQAVFDETGGLHAAALFDAEGLLRALREDVGRHNAVDKLVGAFVLQGALPLADSVLLVSGRASFEIVQKALRAGIPVLAAVGAPSSLAVDLAAEFGMTLIGFVRDGRFNVYTAPQRINLDKP